MVELKTSFNRPNNRLKPVKPFIIENRANINFKGNIFRMSEKTQKKFYTSNAFKKFAKMTSNPVLLDATFVLGLACILRPLTILNLPGAEKRDKQYASAHSIVSGAWGYITSLLLFNPINSAVKNVSEKVKNNPDYLKNTFIKHNSENRDAFNFVTGYGSKLILQPMVAAVTIAMIPSVMNIFFNKNKKESQKTPDNRQKTTTLPQNQKKQTQVQFKGKTPDKNSGNVIVKAIEPLIEKMANNKCVKWFSEKMAKSDPKKSAFMRNILTTGQAFLGTLVYVFSTLHNPKIEQERKKTLAANQFISWSISAVGAITLNNSIQKYFDKIANNYKKFNIEHLEENLEKIAKEKLGKSIVTVAEKEKVRLKELDKLNSRRGTIARNAPTMLAFAFFYRYLTPVLATPLADIYKKHFLKDQKKPSKISKN